MLNFLFVTTLAVLGLAGLICWALAIKWLRQGKHWIEPRPLIATPLGLIDVAIMFVTWFAGQIGSTFLAMGWLGISPESVADAEPTKLAQLALAVATGQLISTTIGILIIVCRYRRMEIFGWRPVYFWRDIRLGLTAFAMVIPAILVLQYALTQLVEYEHSTLEMLREGTSWGVIAAAWFAAVGVAPICEEIFFRGILLAWLQRAMRPGSTQMDRTINGGWDEDYNPYRAADLPTFGVTSQASAPRTNPFAGWPVVVSAAVFAMVHIGQGPAPIPLFFLGLALGYLYQQTGSLTPSIVLHLSLNAFTMFWVTVPILFP